MAKEKEWIDFKKVKDAVDMQMVLDHYGIKGLAKTGDELRGACPIHKGSARSKNFTVNTRKNAFNCFSRDCRTRGNVLDFVAAMEHCDVRDAALKLAEWFGVGKTQSRKEVSGSVPTGEVPHGIYKDSEGSLFEVIANAISDEDSESLIVYRELFGAYRYWVAPPQNFGEGDSLFSLVKTL